MEELETTRENRDRNGVGGEVEKDGERGEKEEEESRKGEGWGGEERERGEETFLAADLVNNYRKEGIIIGKCHNQVVCELMSPLSPHRGSFVEDQSQYFREVGTV